MDKQTAFQDQIPNNHCFGCGPDNADGLKIKSYWSDVNESICTYTPLQHQSAGPTKFLNGGIISTIIDCHCVCTAIAKGYKMSGNVIGQGDTIWFATGNLQVSFIKPVAIDRDVILKTKVLDANEKKITLDCQLFSGDEVCATGLVVAVKVPNNWSA